MKERCFKNQEMPDGILDICSLHIQDYEYATYIEKQTRTDNKAQTKKKVKKMLYSYYAQQNMSIKKWEDNLFKSKLTGVPKIKVVDIEYKAATKQSKSAVEHYTKCLDAKEYTAFDNYQVNQILELQFTDYVSKIDIKKTITSLKVLRCFKTAITLQLVNAHQWKHRDAIGRADCIVDTLIKKSEAIKYQHNVEFINFNGNELMCFKIPK